MGLISNFFGLLKRPNVYYYSSNSDNQYIEGMSARELYITQANLHSVVSFLADSVAQLPLNVYKRESENVRIRDRESSISKLIYKPNADQTAYEFINALSIEYLLFGEAIVLVLPDMKSSSGYQLRVIPSEWVEARKYDTNFAPSILKIRTNDNKSVEIHKDQFIIFKMYSPSAPALYLSPITSLKQTLSEQIQANQFRRSMWKHGGRTNSYITRPANVAPWTKEARDAWKEAWKGWQARGDKAGSVPILEDGMEWKAIQFSAKEAQYAESVQLTREDVAAAYHINPSLVWHTQTQTYASAKDNARALYADTLGPILQMLQQRINSFLVPKIMGDDSGYYVEFNLEEKLKGSFEERATIYQKAAGVPYLTVNEVRAELNRPPIEGGDERVIPLNVLVGGQSSPQDSTPDSYSNAYSSGEVEIKTVDDKNEKAEQISQIVSKFFKRQESSVITKKNGVENWWNIKRWNQELSDDLLRVIDEDDKEYIKEKVNQINQDTYDLIVSHDTLKAFEIRNDQVEAIVDEIINNI